jgi:hypothetical protein
MSYTKRELVNQALEEIGIADYTFDVTPSETESVMRKLDSMIAGWTLKGIMLGYPSSSMANGSELSQDSNIPASAVEAVVTNLAIKIGPTFGKLLSPDTKSTAKAALNSLFACAAMPHPYQLPSMPKGAGYKSVDNYAFSAGPVDKVVTPINESIDLSGSPTDE